MLAHVSEDRPELRADFERALCEALDGFQLRDEEILLAGRPSGGPAEREPRRARSAGVIDDGRAVLVLRPGLHEGPLELVAIDALTWSEEYGEVLAQHLGADPARDVLVVLVVDAPDASLRAALRTLRDDRLLVLVERRVRSARGERLRLSSLDLRGRAIPTATEGVEDFLARLAPPARAWAEAAARGVARIDPGLRGFVADSALVWRDPAGVRCVLRARGAEILGEADGVAGPIRGDDEVERFLERALRACCGTERLEPAPRPASSEDAPKALLPVGPLLSEDELAALRGDA